jgi:putative transposase
MAKPYSIDLRDRVVGSVVRDELSCGAAARRFGVALSTAIKWVQRYRQTGSVAPGQMGGHKPKSIAGDDRAFLLDRIKGGDFTLRGLVRDLAARGLTVDYRTVWNFVHAAKLSYKKNPGRWRARSS